MSNTFQFCSDCMEEPNLQAMKPYNGLKAFWMDVYYEMLFCPCCGQIYTRMKEDSTLQPLVIDEYEESGN